MMLYEKFLDIVFNFVIYSSFAKATASNVPSYTSTINCLLKISYLWETLCFILYQLFHFFALHDSFGSIIYRFHSM